MDSCDSCKFIECVCRHRMDDYYRGIPDLCFSHECVDHVFRHKKEKDMIPQFPQFKRVEITDREAVEAHTHKYEPYSDFNFTSLWAWDTNGERMISELNGNLVRFRSLSQHVRGLTRNPVRPCFTYMNFPMKVVLAVLPMLMSSFALPVYAQALPLRSSNSVVSEMVVRPAKPVSLDAVISAMKE